MQNLKDATAVLTGQLSEFLNRNRIGLVSYDRIADRNVDFVEAAQFSQLLDGLNDLQAGHVFPNTNIQDGIFRALELLNEQGRPGARPFLVVLTDGQPNYYCDSAPAEPCEPAGPDVAEATARTVWAAFYATLVHRATIHTITLGSTADQALMQQIATISNGEHRHAEGSVADISTAILDVFSTVARNHPAVLIQ